MPNPESPARILVAGIGNIFLGDDAFGVEVAKRLADEPLAEGVRVMDVGTGSRQLAYELLDGGYDMAILVDAVSRDGPPGTVYVMEPDEPADAPAPLDAHAVRPEHVLAMLRALGGKAPPLLVVGCEPGCIGDEAGLSAPVAAAVPEAVRTVCRLVSEPIPRRAAAPPR